jgi:hypothetical protein
VNEPVVLMAENQSECSHTPGPWKLDWQPVPGRRVHADFPYLHYVGIQSANYYDVAPNGLSVTGYMRKADALLIASAPEMFDLLKKYAYDGHLQSLEDRERFRKDALALIARAEGRS